MLTYTTSQLWEVVPLQISAETLRSTGAHQSLSQRHTLQPDTTVDTDHCPHLHFLQLLASPDTAQVCRP